MTATITPIRPNVRIATPQRWQTALKRALDEGVQLFQLAGTGECVATSARKPGVAYRTDGTACECEAAQLGADPVCKHRALYWHRLGALDLEPEPDPSGPACWLCGDTRTFVDALGDAMPCGICREAAFLARAAALDAARAA